MAAMDDFRFKNMLISFCPASGHTVQVSATGLVFQESNQNDATLQIADNYVERH